MKISTITQPNISNNEYLAEEIKNLFLSTPKNISNMNIKVNNKWREIEKSLRELEMTIRALPKGQVKFFSRENQIQKFVLPTYSYSVSSVAEEEYVDEPYIELPKNIYRRFVMLVCDQISDIPISLAHRTFYISWEFTETEENEWEFNAEVSVEREIHLPRVMTTRYSG